MKTKIACTALALTVCFVPQARSIDRDAAVIGQIGFRASALDEGDSLGVNISTEIATRAPACSVLIATGGGSVSPDRGQDTDLWHVDLGLRWYLTSLLSVSLTGSHAEYNYADNPDVNSASLGLRYRLAPAENRWSPYITSSAGVRKIIRGTDSSDYGDSYAEFVGTVGLGCDLAVSEQAALSLTGSYLEAEDISDGPPPSDGWAAALALKYYWR